MEPTISDAIEAAPAEEWRTYDEFAAGIDTYRLPDADLSGQSIVIRFDDGPTIELAFLTDATVRWSSSGDHRRQPSGGSVRGRRRPP